MSPVFVVEGGHRLKGTVRPAGNKNAALPILAATLLADGPVTLHNVPRIRDVETLLELLAGQGVSLQWQDEHTLVADARKAHAGDPDPALCSRIRASIQTVQFIIVRRPGGEHDDRKFGLLAEGAADFKAVHSR